jgi:hypothetical protein
MRSNQFAYSNYHCRTPHNDQLVKLSVRGIIVLKQHLAIEAVKRFQNKQR